MVVGAIGTRTGVLVIGGGPGGYVAALRAAEAGHDVTLVDRAELGGTCLNVGCIPSKTLIEVASTRHQAVAGAAHGLLSSIDVDMTAVSGHLAATTETLRNGVRSLLDAAGVTVVRGTANFARYDRVIIEHDDAVAHIEFDHAIIATGSRPRALAALPFGGPILDSTAALALDHLPDHVAVVGGGYIGVELGTAFAKLGSNVQLVEAASSILRGVAPPLRRPVERRLGDLGVQVHTGVAPNGLNGSRLELNNAATIDADVVVVAVGRAPNGDRCSAEVAGATTDANGYINVDADRRAAPGIYAIGDVIAGPALAHRASNDAERVVAHLSGHIHPAPVAMPAVIYSDPEIMSVGVPLERAESAGSDDLQVHRFPHVAGARAHTMAAPEGSTWVVVDADGTVVGVHAVGPHASELAGEATLAIEMAATLDDVACTVHPHPTMSETIAEAAWIGLARPLHVRR